MGGVTGNPESLLRLRAGGQHVAPRAGALVDREQAPGGHDPCAQRHCQLKPDKALGCVNVAQRRRSAFWGCANIIPLDQQTSVFCPIVTNSTANTDIHCSGDGALKLII